jgi:hypothetical protein
MAVLAHAESGKKKFDFEFTNVADSTQGFSQFETFPAINNKSDVAFVAFQDGSQSIFRVHEHQMTTIASAADGLSNFNGVCMNASGVVAFNATTGTGSSAIFTSDGRSKTLIADSLLNGLSRIGVGSPSINASGTVAFFSQRAERGFPSSVFIGTGGPLTTLAATSQTGFQSFSNVGINDAGRIVFRAGLANGANAILTTPGLVTVVDTNVHPEFFDFGDPVINNAGTVGDFAFLNAGGIQAFTANASGITPRNNPANPAFTNSEHPSINNHGAIAFYGFPSFLPTEPTGIFMEVSGGQSLIPVILPGDKLFGSTVVSVDLGRFALNDRFELAFQYSLADGRSGIAIAAFHGEKEGDDQGK